MGSLFPFPFSAPTFFLVKPTISWEYTLKKKKSEKTSNCHLCACHFISLWKMRQPYSESKCFLKSFQVSFHSVQRQSLYSSYGLWTRSSEWRCWKRATGKLKGLVCIKYPRYRNGKWAAVCAQIVAAWCKPCSSPHLSVLWHRITPGHSLSFDITQAHLQALWRFSEHAATTQVLSPASVSGEAAAGNTCKATCLNTRGKLSTLPTVPQSVQIQSRYSLHLHKLQMVSFLTYFG